MSREYKLEDKYFKVASGGLSREYRIETCKVEKIEMTSTGTKYDGLHPFDMYDTFADAKTEALKKTEALYKQDVERLEKATEPKERYS